MRTRLRLRIRLRRGLRRNNLASNVLICLMIIIFSNSVCPQKLVVGYYPDFLKYTLPVNKIQFQNLTHIIHAFASPQANGTINMFNMLNISLNNAVHSAGKKILLGFGGWGQSDGFATMAADSTIRAAFVSNALQVLTEYQYDGIDLDWEFPADAVQKINLTKLVEVLRKGLDSIDSSLLLTMAVTVSDYSSKYFDFEKIVKDIDWFGMMAYDFHGSWSSRSGHNAPLFQNNRYPDGCADLGVKYLNNTRKIPVNKILLGVPFYGREFNAGGLYFTKTGDASDMYYSSVAERLNSDRWEYFWDDISKVPYLLDTAKTKFVTFDDTTSMRIKCEYSKEKDLGGIMIWALGQDVISNSQPLLETIATNMGLVPAGVIADENFIKDFKLFGNYPNPFNSSTIIKFNIAKEGFVNLSVYNSIGQLVTILFNDNLKPGIHEVNISLENMASGIYFYSLISGNVRLTSKMVYMK